MKNNRSLMYVAIIAILFASGCVYNQQVSITTITNTYTTQNAPSLNIIHTPTITFTNIISTINSTNPHSTPLQNTPSNIISPRIITETSTLSCNVTSGFWHSEETIDFPSVYEGSIIGFVIKNCQIIGWEIWTFPLYPEDLFAWREVSNIPIIDQKVAWEVASDNGTFYIDGLFTSPTKAHGKILIPKGYILHEIHIKKDIVINWTAKLGKEKW